MDTLTPTAEQQAILDAARTGDSVTVIAAAGSGKTSTQRMIAHQAKGRRGLYAAYNKSIQLEAEGTFPASCKCSTVHSMAYRAVGASFRHRLGKDAPHVTASQAARILRINEALKLGDTMIQPNQLARLAQQAVKNFCKSGSSEIQPWHVPVVTGLEGVPERDAIRSVVHPIAVRAWKDLSSLEGRLRFSHDCQPPGTLVRRVTRRGGQFGSSFEDVPIETIREGDYVVSFSMNRRRGYVRRAGRPVTAVGGRDYSGDLITVTTARGRRSSYTAEHRCVVRLDCDLTEGNYVVYLARRGQDYRVGRTTWRTPSQSNTLGLRRRADNQGADAIWLLSVHPTDADAALEEALVAHQWRLPTWQFRSGNETMPLARFWAKAGGNRAAADACLTASGLDIRYPFWQEGDGWQNVRRPVIMRALNLRPGMLVLEPDEVTPNSRDALSAYDGADGWSPITITRVPYEGPVYNLDVADDHTYVADGIATHNCYLKLWAMSDPVLPYDYVLFDEAQDANPVILRVIQAQASHAQLIAVGDPCQPPGTMVTVVRAGRKGNRWTGITPVQTVQIPIEQLREGDRVVSYNVATSYLRRTGSAVTGISIRPFSGDLVTVRTAGHYSRYTPNHKCVVRFGPGLSGKHVVYLMRRGRDYRIGITSARSESQGNRLGVTIRAAQEGADAVWILSVHPSRSSAALAEMTTAWTYGVPTLTFRTSNHSSMTQADLDLFWHSRGGNHATASAALRAHGRDITYPLWSTADNRTLQQRRPTVIRACNLIDGMQVLPLTDDMMADHRNVGLRHWTDVTVGREHYDGPVYSMNVEKDHTYVGDGLITHNCQAINGWNGAVNAMNLFDAPHRLALSTSFRFGPAIAAEANKWLGLLDAEYRITGNDRLSSMIRDVDTPDAILCRSNSKAIEQVMDRIGRGQRVALAGGADELIRLAQAAVTLKAGTGTDHPALFAFKTWLEVQDYAENDPSGSDLKVFVKLIDDHGPDQIIEALDQLADRRRCDVMISTAHKAKGMEWDSVRVATDFREPQENQDGTPGEVKPEQAMLAYVTVTRARLSLDRAGLAWVDRYITPAAPAAAAEAPARASDLPAAADLALTGANA